MNRIPSNLSTNKILIVCEGPEEYDYLSKLKTLDVWSHEISVVLKPAKSLDNIKPIYEYHFQNGNYAIVFIFCDTEIEPYEQFKKLRKSIDKYHGKNISKDIVFFANPCTMQLVLSHFKNIKLDTNSKEKNSVYIKKLTGVESYRATQKQREEINNKINKENYSEMKKNIGLLKTDYENIPSSNFLELLDILEKGDMKRIKNINKKLG